MSDSRPIVVAVTGDLMLESRLARPVEAAGARLCMCATIDELRLLLASERPAAAVVDLAGTTVAQDEALAALRGAGSSARVLGFFPHVMRELGRAAEQAGYDMVVPRSRFLMDPAALIATLLEEGRQLKP